MDRKRSALSSAGAKLLEPKSAVPLRGRERSERSADVEVVESGRQRSNSHTERPERLEKLDKWEKPSDVSAAKPFSASPSPEPPEPSEKQEAGRSSSRRPREKEQKEADEDLEALLKGLDDASLSPRPSATTAAPAAAAASAEAAAAAAPAPVPAASPCKPPTEAHSVTAQGGPEYCTACKKQFEGGQSIYESRLSGEPQSLCKACWSQVAPHCAACGELVSGTMARVGEDTYHQQCLKCAFCKKAINGQLTKMDVGLACSSCSDEIDREFKELRQVLSMGDEAGAALIVGSLKARGLKPPDTTNDLGQCSSCFCRFKVGQQVYESPDAKVCESCFLQSAPKCGACGKPVIGTVARVGETAFHPDCLVCSGCGQKLTGAFAKTDSGFKCANCRP